MKYARFILPAILLLPAFLFAQSGSSCGTAIPLTLDNVVRNYASSTTTDVNLLCTDNGITPVTWFSFTTDAAGECPLLTISASDGLASEVVVYSGCNGAATPILTSSMCFEDGNGLWAPAMPSPFDAHKTYYLRIKTSTACTISIGGQNYTPSNDDCLGAFSISTVGIADNNSCHHPPYEVTAPQLCAASLENTAFYQFYVDATGNCVINISNISCDNAAGNNRSGFQIGFFTGSCSSLTHLHCDSNSNMSGSAFLQFTTPSLPENTKVYVAIDGFAGSNCSYTIGGINILGVLSKTLKNFSGWKMGNSNILKWTMLNETDGYYEIERSENGIDFLSIGKIKSKGASTETTYSFEDHDPFSKNFYRLRQTDGEGKISLSHIIQIDRRDLQNLDVRITNPVYDLADINIITASPGKYGYRIINIHGQVQVQGTIFCNNGSTRFQKAISNLATGQYYFILDNDSAAVTRPFVKMN